MERKNKHSTELNKDARANLSAGTGMIHPISGVAGTFGGKVIIDIMHNLNELSVFNNLKIIKDIINKIIKTLFKNIHRLRGSK